MKKLAIVFLSILSINAAAQEDTLFPNISGTWSVNTWVLAGGPLYGGYDCWAVSGTDTLYGQVWDGDILASGLHGKYRLDSGKIIIKYPWLSQNDFMNYGPYHSWSPPDTNEIVMYDFNLTAGDTAYWHQHDSTGWGAYPITVDSVGYSTILGVERKTLYLTYNEKWIAGMGSDHGFFYPVCSHFEIGVSAVCFNGEYEDSLVNNYDLQFEMDPGDCSLSIEDIKAATEPAIKTRCGLDKLWITLQKPESVKIFSADGKLVYGMELPAGESVFEFDFLERGAYIIRIGANYAEKFIKN